MAVICDTGGIYALYDADDAYHDAVRWTVEEERGPLFVPTAILAEIDYLLHVRLGADAALDFISSIESDAFRLEPLLAADVVRCRELMSQYVDLGVGLADASVVATAERLQIQRLLTVDIRHFRAIRPQTFDHFVLLPADEMGPDA